MRRLRLPILLLAFLMPVHGWAAIAEVASMRANDTASDFTSDTTAFPNNITANQLLVMAGNLWNAGDVLVGSTTVTGCSTTFTVVFGSAISDDGGFYRPFIARGVAGSTGACTLTLAPPVGTYGTWVIDAFSGIDTGTPLDVDGGSSTSSSTAPADAITTLTANALIIAVLAHSGGGVIIDPDGTYTQFGEEEFTAVSSFSAQFKLLASAGADTADWTLGSSVPWSAQTMSFKEASTAQTVGFYRRRP